MLAMPKIKKSYIVLIIALFSLLVGGGWSLANHPLRNQFNGWTTGLIPVGDKGSVLLAVNPSTREYKKIVALPEIASHCSGAVSPDGKYAAYTQWNENGTALYLNIQEVGKENTKQVLFSDKPEQEITNLSWLPDGHRLLFVLTKKEMYPHQEICIFDVRNKILQPLVEGGVWDGRDLINTVDGNETWKDSMSQEELDQLIKKYGGPKTIPVEENGSKLFVKFSAPSVSPDGKTIAYSATLFRNFAKKGTPVWLASSIWTINTDEGELKRIYCNPEAESAIGRVTWSSDGKNLVFYRYQGMNGESGRLDCLNLDSQKVKTLVPLTKQHFTNFNALTMPDNNLLFISVPQDEPDKLEQYIVNIDSGKIEPFNLQVDNQSVLLLGFSNLF